MTLYVVLAVLLVAQAWLFRRIWAQGKDLEKLRRDFCSDKASPGEALEPNGGEAIAQFRAPVPGPQPTPRLVSPTRAKLAMERQFSQRARAAEVLRRAAKEQAR